MSSGHTSFFDVIVFYGALTGLVASVIAVFIFLLLPTQKQEVQNEMATVPVMTQPLTTDVWGVFDADTGAILMGENLDTKQPIASVSKLFTAYAVMQSSMKDDAFTITHSDVATEGRSGKLVYGEMVTPYTLLFPLLIESSNDAAVAISRYMGPVFSTTIHDVTESLALTNTVIAEPSGLSARDVSSVRDLATFYSYLSKKEPHILDITRLPMYVALRDGYINNSPAIQIKSYRGGKHGFTEEAGRTFVGAFATESGKEIGVVILGSTDLLHDIEILRTQGGKFASASAIMAQ
jgi:D-alanyl-D-alanine carboxypeptidase